MSKNNNNNNNEEWNIKRNKILEHILKEWQREKERAHSEHTHKKKYCACWHIKMETKVVGWEWDCEWEKENGTSAVS